jgi:hypothetical protein
MLPDSTRGKISLYTGAIKIPSDLLPLVENDTGLVLVLETWIETTIARLDEIETLRQESLGDTLALKVGSLELSYQQHYRIFFTEARQLVEKLIHRLKLEDTQNYFSQIDKDELPSNVTVSYW